MSSLIEFLILLAVLLVLMAGYLRLADRYNIIDHPNERSSHTRVTIRGGGIIFVVAVLAWWVLEGFPNLWFFLGFLLISGVSFIDDLGHVSNRIRISTHFIAVLLLMVGAPEFIEITDAGVSLHLSLVGLLLIPVALGFINAYNFMDGINGITVVNALVTICSMAWLNHELYFIDPELLTYCIAGLLVFGFFNFRIKAKAFAGDVGAVSIAFVLLLLMLNLVTTTGEWAFIAFLLVYGVDSVGTIIQRLVRKENIFEAHRTHLYQLMVNESGWSHLVVSALYGAVQLVINVAVIAAFTENRSISVVFGIALVLLIAIFAYAKIRVYRVFAKG